MPPGRIPPSIVPFSLAAVVLLSSPSPTRAQIETPDYRRILRPDPVAERDRDPARTLLALNPRDGAWLAVFGETAVMSSAPSIPREMEDKLREFLRKGRRIDVVEFTPTGGWTIVAEDLNWTRGVGGDYYDELQKLTRQGQRIRAVAFNPVDWGRNRGFVIVHDQGVVARGVPAEMRSKLREYDRAGHEIRIVEFTPTGGWTIITDRANWTRGVGGTEATRAERVEPGALLMANRLAGDRATPVSYFDRITGLSGRGDLEPDAVAFDPGDYASKKGYILVQRDRYWAQDVSPRLAHRLETEIGLDGEYLRTIPPSDESPDEPRRPNVVAETRNAVIDLQRVRIDASQERRGDEPYLVVYPLRGRLGVRGRVHFWDPVDQIRVLHSPSGRTPAENWAQGGRTFDIRGNMGRIDFRDVEPFEVYGVVLVFLERDGTDYEVREDTFGRGVWKGQQGLSAIVTDRFDRALPYDARRPNYQNLGESNVRSIVEDVFTRLRQRFERGLKEQIVTTFVEHTKRVIGNADDLLDVQAMFFVNAPGLSDEAVTGIGGDLALPPGPLRLRISGALSSGGPGPSSQDHNDYTVVGEHRFYSVGGGR